MNTRQHILIRLRAGEWVSGEAMSESLGISRAAVSKHIAALRVAGCEIESASRKGYWLVREPDRLDRDAVAPYLETTQIGQAWNYSQRVESTNALAREAALGGAAEGAVFVADEQVGGRGRRGREWVSPAGCGIYVSVLLRPQLAPDELPLLTLMAAVAVARAIGDAGAANVRIKWPNDILLCGHKVCGILTEMVADAECMTSVVLGIGLNVNTPANQLPDRPLFPAGSLASVAGQRFSRVSLLGGILTALERGYHELCKAGPAQLLSAWEAHSDLTGKRVRVQRVHDAIEGVAEGLDVSGALVVRDDVDKCHLILAGDITYC
jgi:BirA family biotin operon repressor/biotin-[acetyl-CoA-carboxylase] ligase